MKESDIEIVQDPRAVSRIFELMLEGRRPLSVVQHGRRSDAWVVRVSCERLILVKRDKGSHFTSEPVEFQFRCPLGRNIAGKSRIVRLNAEYLELVLPAKVVIVQRRQAYRVVPTADSIAVFQNTKRWILAGWIENLSANGLLVRLPQGTTVVVPSDIQMLWLLLNHLAPADELTPGGVLECYRVRLKAATMVRKADTGKSRIAAYGVHFEPTVAEERQLSRIIVGYARAALVKGVGG